MLFKKFQFDVPRFGKLRSKVQVGIEHNLETRVDRAK